jgi:hypothetical protein
MSREIFTVAGIFKIAMLDRWCMKRPASEPIDHSRLKIYYSLGMYRRPKFLEVLHEIREEMSREADYDMDLFAEMVRNGEGKKPSEKGKKISDDERLTTARRPLTTVYGNRF